MAEEVEVTTKRLAWFVGILSLVFLVFLLLLNSTPPGTTLHKVWQGEGERITTYFFLLDSDGNVIWSGTSPPETIFGKIRKWLGW